ncbi:hypothetical protein P3T43_001774 [Paraburkholderia sp. GAS41]|uniref:hypothetical protein n=1 Tax=Paraburkholderia sp. GAS41 TaxID=3035134 RepID=UPI003D2355E6
MYKKIALAAALIAFGSAFVVWFAHAVQPAPTPAVVPQVSSDTATPVSNPWVQTWTRTNTDDNGNDHVETEYVDTAHITRNDDGSFYVTVRTEYSDGNPLIRPSGSSQDLSPADTIYNQFVTWRLKGECSALQFEIGGSSYYAKDGHKVFSEPNAGEFSTEYSEFGAKTDDYMTFVEACEDAKKVK